MVSIEWLALSPKIDIDWNFQIVRSVRMCAQFCPVIGWHPVQYGTHWFVLLGNPYRFYVGKVSSRKLKFNNKTFGGTPL